jgi:hypothetical protein
MLNGKKLITANEKLLNISQDLSWLEYNDVRAGHDLSIMSLKSLLLQIKDVEKILEEVINEKL